jgi:DNA repair photolyase
MGPAAVAKTAPTAGLAAAGISVYIRSMAELFAIRGRGAAENPPNRFERIAVEPDGDALDAALAEGESVAPRTIFLRDATRGIIARNNSPDIGFDASVNPYRGCEHGCVYCYARPTHEYLGFSAGLDFESRILVKLDAAALLRRELQLPKWRPQVLAMSGVTDPYQPVERKLRITRGCLEVLAEFRNPVAMVTKNHLVTRDVDLLADMAGWNGAAVNVSITSLDEKLQRIMEPRTSVPARRLLAVETLARAGVPVRVMVAPVIPGLNDREIPAILEAAAAAGARGAAYVALRLPYAVAPLFENWLERHFPNRREKVLNRLREMRGGRLYDSRFGARMKGEGVFADQIGTLFRAARAKAGLDGERFELCTTEFRLPPPPPPDQLALF